MNGGFIAVLLAASALAAPAFAEAVPKPGAQDVRLRTIAYDPANVTVVVASPGRTTSIELAPGETIEGITVGNERAWVVAPLGGRLFVKPNEAEGLKNTNMQIVSKRQDGTTRLYQLDLVASPDTSLVMAGIRYIYPGDEQAERAAKASEAAARAETQTAEDRLVVDFFYGVRNWKFVGRGSSVIEPTEVSDNGRITVFRFPGNMRHPAVFTGPCGAGETIAPVTVRDDLVLVQTTAASFCLRDGGEVVELRNVGYDPVGFNPRTGTSTPEVVRTIRTGGRP